MNQIYIWVLVLQHATTNAKIITLTAIEIPKNVSSDICKLTLPNSNPERMACIAAKTPAAIIRF